MLRLSSSLLKGLVMIVCKMTNPPPAVSSGASVCEVGFGRISGLFYFFLFALRLLILAPKKP